MGRHGYYGTLLYTTGYVIRGCYGILLDTTDVKLDILDIKVKHRRYVGLFWLRINWGCKICTKDDTNEKVKIFVAKAVSEGNNLPYGPQKTVNK